MGPVDTKEWRSADTLRLFAAVAENRVARIRQVSAHGPEHSPLFIVYWLRGTIHLASLDGPGDPTHCHNRKRLFRLHFGIHHTVVLL